jgi:Big-like domain-containing protein
VPVLIRRLSVLLLVGVALVRPVPAVAATDVGYEGPTYVSTAPTGEKPESKAWFNDGFWWASMWDTASSRYEIFKLNTGTQTWSSTNVSLDTRSNTKADTLWDGTKLYVSSHVFSKSPALGYASYLYRFSYNASTDTYTLDAGFRQTINNYRSESLVIDKDSTGQLWATWTFNSRVYVNRTTSGDTAWGAPFLLPNASQVASDDISSLIAFDGNKIGVFWGDQRGATFRFATHNDTDVDATWSTVVTVLPGPNSADDHMNLKSLATDDTGRVFAAIKTSKTNSGDPIIQLFVRSKTPTVHWTAYTIWKVSDHLTRPIVLLDTTNNRIHVFASTEGGGKVYEKTSSLSSIGFGSGLGTIVMSDASSNGINDSTSTKQNLSGSTGLMVLASNDLTKRYWHHYDSLGAGGGNATPVCSAVSATVPQDSPGVDIPPNCTDTDGPNALTYTISSPASHGAATINGSSLHYKPTSGYSGGDSFGYTAFDGLATSAEAMVTVTITPSGTPVTAISEADTYVKEDEATIGHGSANTIRSRLTTAGVHINSYLRFTVTGAGANSSNEILRLYVTDPSVDPGKLYQVLDDTWTEGMLYNNQPALGPLIIDLGTLPPSPALGYWDIDVSTYVNGNETYSFAIVGESNDLATFSSRETANPPQLVVTPS